MNVRKTLLNDWPVWVLLLLPFVLLGFFWNQLPERLPMHWNAAGEVNRWGSKNSFEVFLLPGLNVLIYFLLVFIPYIDPKQKTDNRQKALRAFRYILPLLMTSIFALLMFEWLGYDLDAENFVLLILALFFLVMGNYMQSIKPNYFIGIRTPWTLESPENWRKTHRVGGKIWVVTSIIMLALWFILPSTAHGIAIGICVTIMVVSTVGYSFYLYTKEKKAEGAAESPTEQETA